MNDYYVFAINILIKHLRLNEKLCDAYFTDPKRNLEIKEGYVGGFEGRKRERRNEVII